MERLVMETDLRRSMFWMPFGGSEGGFEESKMILPSEVPM